MKVKTLLPAGKSLHGMLATHYTETRVLQVERLTGATPVSTNHQLRVCLAIKMLARNPSPPAGASSASATHYPDYSFLSISIMSNHRSFEQQRTSDVNASIVFESSQCSRPQPVVGHLTLLYPITPLYWRQ